MTLELPDIQCNRITNENKHWLEAENLIALIALLFTVIFLYPGFGPLLALLSAIIFSLILYFFFHSSLWDKIKIQVLNYFWINLLQLDKRKVELLDYYYQSNEQQKQFNKYSYTLAQNMYIKYEIEKITITAINSPNGARDDIETFIRNQREQHIPIRQTWNSVIYRIYNLIYNEEQKELEITFIPGCYSDYI